MKASELEPITRKIRGQVVELSHGSGASHLGGSLSAVDILTTLYWSKMNIDPQKPDSPDRDRFIMSKGHAAAAFYTTLCFRGFFGKETLLTYAKEGTKLAEHPGPKCAPGVEAATGSLGHGLPIGLGMAVAGKRQNRNYKVYVLLSDGECNEGSVWEGAMFAAANKLDNVCVVVDFNKWQATGRSEEVMQLQPLREKWEKFGWDAYEIDGHNLQELLDALEKFPSNGKPVAIIANTVKGKGISFMEDDNNWHYRIPTEEEVQQAKEELGL